MDALGSLRTALSDRYRIERELGAGGMATVYLAHDVKHDRKVAIKFLHPELAAVLGAERFVNEMRVTANLQHPHILPLFDSGIAGSQLYYVMPLVEGESLRERLTRERQLSIDDAVRITGEVASALDYAHRRQVVHRDIKPENILLHDGSALVADFGIALAVSNAGDKRLTQTGLSLGTPQYMSPEQATGDKAVDGRTDIYSLGCCLFEMLTGEPPFSGPSTQAIVAKVLTEPMPSVRSRRSTVSPALEAVVMKAVQKLPADRYATPQAFAQALRAPEHVLATVATPVASRPAPLLRQAATAVVALAAIGGAFMAGRQSAAAGVDAWTLEQLDGPGVAMNPRISPDGKTVAFAAMAGSTTQLAVLSPETGDWRVLTTDTTRGFVNTPAWSPDGTRIYYGRYNEGPNGIYSITPLGSDNRLVLELADSPQVLPDGSLLVVRLNADRRLQLYRYWPESARLDTLEASTTLAWGKSFVRAFPDGKEAAFFGVPGAQAEEEEALYAIDLTNGSTRKLYDRPMARLGGGESFGIGADNQSVLLRVSLGEGYAVARIPRDGSGASRVVLSSTSRIASLDGGPDGSIYVDQIERGCIWVRYDPRTRASERHSLNPRCGNQILPLPDGRILDNSNEGLTRRVLLLEPGQPPRRFLAVDQPTADPAPLGNDRVLIRFGARLDTLLVTAIATGQVTARVPWFPDVSRYTGSPNGKTIYYARAGVIWEMPATGGESRRVRDGDLVTVDPSGRYLVVAVNAADRIRLFHVPLDGTPEREIPIRGPLRFSAEAINLRAIAPDGRILFTGVSTSLWHWQAALLDPRTGAVEILPGGEHADTEASWTHDGKVWIVGDDLESTMWRYRPTQPAGR